MIRVGTAGWAIPSDVRAAFPQTGSRLEQYAQVFSCVEINSTFYGSHRASTYARWAASVPEGFRFALKFPKEITHVRRLDDCADLLKAFIAETAALGAKRAVLLVQLPPSLAFDERTTMSFLDTLRREYAGGLACEPRHASWFGAAANAMLQAYSVVRVAADPARVPVAATPGGFASFAYYRWHGTPRVYYSSYEPERIATFAKALDTTLRESWCIFDNTARGAATSNALLLASLVGTTDAFENAR